VQVEINIQDCFFPTSDGKFTTAITESTWEKWFQTWLADLQPHLSANACELSLRLTDDAEIQSLNAQYRHQNQPTDVLAFAALEVDCPQPAELLLSQPLYLGDIVISVDTASKQSSQQGHSLDIELAWLAAHGLLHLLGWDHPDEDSLTLMLEKQATLLHSLGLQI